MRRYWRPAFYCNANTVRMLLLLLLLLF